jgi:hypothetical protein
MTIEWLTERCLSNDPCGIRLQEMTSLDLSEDNKRELLDRSDEFHEWVETRWNPFIASMLPGDELWRFRSPNRTWANMAGRAGYSIVRDGKVIRSLITLMN